MQVKITQTDNTACNTYRKDWYHINVRAEKNRWEFWIPSLPSHQKYWLIWFALYIQYTAKNSKKNTIWQNSSLQKIEQQKYKAIKNQLDCQAMTSPKTVDF